MKLWTCAIHGPTSTDCRGCDDELIALTESDAIAAMWERGAELAQRADWGLPYLTVLAEQMDAADESDEARWAEIDAMDVEGES